MAVIARFSQVTTKDSSVDARPSPGETTQPATTWAAAATTTLATPTTPSPAPTGPRTAATPTNTGPMTTRAWLSAVGNATADIKSPYKLVVSVAKKTWIRIRMDNGQTYEEKLAAGAVRMWVTDRPFAISMGNAGGARLELNGRPLPSADGVEISNVVLGQQ
jgi:cytoskeleton protein RodZ